MTRKPRKDYARDLKLMNVFTIIATGRDGKTLSSPLDVTGNASFLLGPYAKGDSEVLSRSQAIKWLVENVFPEVVKQVFTPSFLTRIRELDKPCSREREFVSVNALALLGEVFTSLQCSELKANGTPIPMTALVELVQHHPGLAEEVDAMALHARAMPVVQRLEQGKRGGVARSLQEAVRA